MDRRNALWLLGGFSALCSGSLLADTPKIGIKIGFVPITDHLLIIAKELFNSANFTIVPIKFASWTDLAEALRAGAVDAAFLLAPLGLMLKANGVDIKAVLSAHKNGSSLVVKSDLSNLKELDGKKVAVPSRFSTHYFLLDKIVKDAGISVNIVEIPPPEMPFALLSGQISGYIVAEPFGQIAVRFKGRAKNLILSRDIKPNHICCTLNFRSNLLKESYFDELILSFKKAAEFINSRPDISANLGEKLLGQKSEIIKEVLDKKIAKYDDLSLKKDDLEELRDFLTANNLGNEKLANLDIDEYLENR